MSKIINLYGDQQLSTATGHGIDVASQRADDLDLMAIEHIHAQVKRHGSVSALDAGCGHGGQTARMSKAGAKVLAMDIENYEPLIADAMKREGHSGGFVFRCVSVTEQPDIGPFDVIMCQRMIHYLPYQKARETLCWFRGISSRNGYLFLSASGMNSELGEHYSGKGMEVDHRFCTLSQIMTEKHAIYPPVCLYRLDELTTLASESGWIVQKAFISSFGNIKIVARKGERA